MKETRTVFRCDRCGGAQEGDTYETAPHGWRRLSWSGGFQGDEAREGHFCDVCSPRLLSALDVILGLED